MNHLTTKFCILFAFATPCSAQTFNIVVPNELAAVEGDVPSVVPDRFEGGDRFQELFPAEQFATVPETHRWLTAIRLRPDSSLTEPFSQDENFLVQLSSTPRTADTLGLEFAANHGSDVKTVFDGELTLASNVGGTPNGPSDFDLLIDLDEPFYYDPNLELNLLLDVTERGARAPIALDRHGLFGTSAVFVASDSSELADLRIPGAVMQFEFSTVPEPATFHWMVTVLIGVYAVNRSGKRRKAIPKSRTE